jgi:DNA-directed RNA polymerase specialized sigma24 family protein
MFSAKQSATQPYAIAADFCRIFENEMNRLYLLSYLLTGDRGMAEACFERSLEDATHNNRVFRDWATSWARRAIMLNAIAMVRPRQHEGSLTSSGMPDANEPAPISAVLELPAFERFVFVMSVLEGQSPRECSLLLGCSRDEVLAAQSRALQQMGQSSERPREAKRSRTSEPKPRRHHASLIPDLVVSA